MRIKFLGVGSAFTTNEYYQSNMMITAASGRRMLIDCGSDIRFSLDECQIHGENISSKIDAVYISHLHADHIGGMEWMAINAYFNSGPPLPKLFMEKRLMHKMWTCSLKGGLGCVDGKVMELADYFDCRPVNGDGMFTWEGIQFTLIRMPHVNAGRKKHCSYGLYIEEENPSGSVFISTDTLFCSDIIHEHCRNASIIFHDCETTPLKTKIHAHYDDLKSLPASLRSRMWLYHYSPNPHVQPEADGFLGFVRKGMEFTVPCNGHIESHTDEERP